MLPYTKIKAKIFTFLIVLSQIAFGFGQAASAQETRQLTRDKPAAAVVEKRVALVIGNGDYEHTKSLKNPVNDAEDMTAKLRNLGFEVVSGTNQNKRGMMNLIREFGTKLIQQGGVGLFFYAGHGLQVGGKNYLIPVDAEILAEDEIADQSVDVGFLLNKIDTAKNNLNILILDACRDNPFAEKWSGYRSTGENSGLAKVSPPTGTIMLYATQPGNTASDGVRRNGLFTESFLERVGSPNVELDKLIKLVTSDVTEKSNKKQFPWREGNSLGDFYFVKDDQAAEKPIVSLAISAPSAGTLAPVISPREETAWNEVKNSADPEDFKFFLNEFPNGYYSGQARRSIEQFAWDAVKNTNDKAKIRAYLEQYPDGLNSFAARNKLRQIESRETANAPAGVSSEKKEFAGEVKKTVDEPVESVKTPEPVKENSVAETADTAPEKTFSVKIAEPKTTVKAKTPTRKTAGKTAGKKSKVENRTNALGIEFVLIPAGSFMMGATAANIAESQRMARKDYADMEPDWYKNELPARRVEIPADFWMSKTEITQAQWQKVMETTPSLFKDCGECPVERVSWMDAKEFVKKLNETDDGFVYALPSEAEWEYAARGGTAKLFAGIIEEISWHSNNSEGRTQPAGSKEPNTFGLHDMNGNVAEWCEDAYTPNYDQDQANGDDSDANKLNLRVVRGGSWNVFPTFQRATQRSGAVPTLRNIVTGFRITAHPKQ